MTWRKKDVSVEFYQTEYDEEALSDVDHIGLLQGYSVDAIALSLGVIALC